jgi:hypothetical protein
MANLETFLQDLLSSFLPGYETSEGGVLHQRIIQPILDRVGEGALTTDVNAFLKARLLEEFPEASAQAGDAITDILIHATGLFFEAYRREIAEIAAAQSLSTTISLQDAEALAANWFVVPNNGNRATTFVRVEFLRPTTVEITSDVVFSTKAGLRFVPADTTTVTAFAMLDNVLANGNYYTDILVVAEKVGTAYNVAEKEIVSVSGIVNTQAVYNTSKVDNGVNADDAASLIRSIPKAINERSIVTSPGLVARLSTRLDNVSNVQVIGFRDPEMERDVATTSASAETYAFGVFMSFDRHIFAFVHANEKPVEVGDLLQLHYPASVYGVADTIAPQTFKITSVTPMASPSSAQKRYLLYVDGTPAPPRISDIRLADGLLLGYCEAQIPPVVITSIDTTTAVHPSGEVHFGGHSDAYISTYTDKEGVAALSARVTGRRGRGFTVDADTPSMVIVEEESIPPHLLVNGASFHILEGDLAGVYLISYTTSDAGSVSIHLREELTPGAYAEIAWAVSDSISIDLHNPIFVKLPLPADVFTVDTTIGSRTVMCSVEPVTYDVVVGDTLELTYQGITDTYTISAIDGVNVTVSRVLPATWVNVPARVFTAEEGVPRPLTQVTKVVLGENTIPYGEPLLTEITQIGGARALVLDGSGSVFPAIQSCLPSDGVPVDITVPAGYASTFGNERSYSADADLPDRVILTLESWNGAISEFTQEIYIPEFVWRKDRPNNVFVATGEVSYADISAWIDTYFKKRVNGGIEGPADSTGRLADIPIPRGLPDPAPLVRGDILTLSSGPNEGSYVVDESWLLQINLGTTEDPVRLPIRFIKIQEEFPSTPLSGLYDSLGQLLVSKAGKSTIEFGDVLRLFLSPAQLLTPELLEMTAADAVDIIQESLATVVASPDLTDIITSLRAITASRYSCGKPATGVARIYFQDPVTFSVQGFAPVRQTAITPVDGLIQPARITSLATGMQYVLGEVSADIVYSTPESKLLWNRDLEFSKVIDLAHLVSSVNSGDCTIPSILSAEIGFDGRDIIEICPQIHTNLLPEAGASDFLGMGVISTKSGSNKVTWQPTINEIFPLHAEDVGSLFFLESGPDAGSYVITAIDEVAKTLTLNRNLTYTTPAIRTRGRCEVLAPDSITLQPIVGLRTPNDTDVGKYVTIYNAKTEYLDPLGRRNVQQTNVGTYQIVSVSEDAGTTTVVLEGTLTDAFFDLTADASWIITEKPTTDIVSLDGGMTECVGQVDYRIYTPNAVKLFLYSITDGVCRFRTLGEEYPGVVPPFDGFNMRNPYTFYRDGQFLITSKEMAQNTDGPMYYADVPVISLGFQDEFNTAEKVCDIAPYRSEGYRMQTASSKSSFSMEETVSIVLPTKFTPATEDYFTSRVLVSEELVSVYYTYCTDVSTVQAIVDNYANKVMCADILARRMLPANVGMSITYSEGLSETAMLEVVSDFVTNSFASRNVLSVSSLVSTLYSKGATHVVLPIEILYVVEDLHRRRFLRKSQDALRYVDKGYYAGTPRITHWNPSSTMILLSRNAASRNLGV